MGSWETRWSEVSPTLGRTPRTHCLVRGQSKTPKAFSVDGGPVDARVLWESWGQFRGLLWQPANHAFLAGAGSVSPSLR